VLGGAFGVEAHDPPFTIEDYKLAPGEDVLVVARASSAGETAVDLFVVDGNGFETPVGTVGQTSIGANSTGKKRLHVTAESFPP